MLPQVEGAFRPSAWLGVRSADPPATSDERHRGERTLAIARVCLAASLFIASALDPLDVGPPSLVHLLLGAYTIFAVLALGLLRLRLAHWTAVTGIVHFVDLTATAGLMLATDAGSPFWLTAIFTVIAAARRWGFFETIGTAVVVVALSLGPAWPTDVRSLYELIAGPTLLLLAGILLAYIAQAEKQLRNEAGELASVASRIELRLGLKHTMTVVFDAVVRLVEADRALLVVREVSSGKISLWEGGRQTEANVAPRVTPIGSQSFEHYMVAPVAGAWYAVRRTTPRERVDIVALARDGSRTEQGPRSLPEPLLAAIGPFRRLMAVSFEMPGELEGRLFLVDPVGDRNRESAMAFGRRIMRHIGPAVYNVYLLHRLRSRSAANERARVARELHDGIIQSVLGVQIQLHALSVPAAKTSRALASELNRLGTILRDETVSLRDMMQRLTPLELPPELLMDTIADVVQRFQRDTGITARFITPFDRLDLPPRACREVTRVVQEALVNVRKHSGARNVVVRLTADGGACQLSIDDDGRGFSFAGRFSQADLEHSRLGPWVIRERVRLLGGKVVVESDPGHGTRIEVSFPLAAHHEIHG
jgi:signal transduction histidine kinase